MNLLFIKYNIVSFKFNKKGEKKSELDTHKFLSFTKTKFLEKT
jgi:hypothetical protein